jgi:hypothetical protein
VGVREAGLAAESSAATATLAAPTRAATDTQLQEALANSRRQSIAGFVVLTFVVLVMLGGMILLAKWLAP